MIKKFLIKLTGWGEWGNFAKARHEKSLQLEKELAEERRQASVERAQEELKRKIKRREALKDGIAETDLSDEVEQLAG